MVKRVIIGFAKAKKSQEGYLIQILDFLKEKVGVDFEYRYSDNLNPVIEGVVASGCLKGIYHLLDWDWVREWDKMNDGVGRNILHLASELNDVESCLKIVKSIVR